MQKITDIIKKAALAFFAVVIATSCVMEKEQVSNSLRSVMVQLDVSAGPMTKAVVEDPTDLEQAINTLRIFAFDNTRLAGHVFLSQGNVESVFMDMLIPTSGHVDIDFYAIANEQAMRLTSTSPAISSSMTKEQLSALSFDAIHNIATYGLPMSAVKTEVDISADDVASVSNDAAGHQGHMILDRTVEIGLSRPLAKISLYATKKEQASTLVISDVTMLAGGTRQCAYLYKPDDAILEAIPSRTNDRNLFSGSLTVGKYLTSEAEKTDPSKYEPVFENAYLPEVPFDGGSLNSVILSLAYSGGYGAVADNGLINMPKVERDVHYKLYCSFAANGKMTIDFLVADWEDAITWPGGLVFDHPTHSYLLPDASSTDHPSGPAVMSYVEGDDSKAFVAYFQMPYPAEQSWRPTIFDGIAADCRVEVWKIGGTAPLPSSEDIKSGNEWYMIKVVPEKADNVGRKLKLAVTYSPTWSDQAEFLMINGSQSDIVWPYAAGENDIFQEDPNYIVITQI